MKTLDWIGFSLVAASCLGFAIDHFAYGGTADSAAGQPVLRSRGCPGVRGGALSRHSLRRWRDRQAALIGGMQNALPMGRAFHFSWQCSRSGLQRTDVSAVHS